LLCICNHFGGLDPGHPQPIRTLTRSHPNEET
jgi:hypothetical protein